MKVERNLLGIDLDLSSSSEASSRNIPRANNASGQVLARRAVARAHLARAHPVPHTVLSSGAGPHCGETPACDARLLLRGTTVLPALSKPTRAGKRARTIAPRKRATCCLLLLRCKTKEIPAGGRINFEANAGTKKIVRFVLLGPFRRFPHPSPPEKCKYKCKCKIEQVGLH